MLGVQIHLSDGRTKNTSRNILAGLLNQMVSIVLPFVNRTVVLRTMGADFTGLAGLFLSILGVLNIAELGFNTAVVYSLYRPMAEHDEDAICEIVSLLRKIYLLVGTAILGFGILLMPFLPNLIHGSYPDSINLYLLYFLYLINSAVSYYLFAYKECLLIADQRQDIAHNIRSVVSTARYILQFIVLLATHNFYCYLITAVLGTVVTNISIQYATLKRYPYFHFVQSKLKPPKSFFDQMKGLLIDRICNTCRNSFDGIIISSFVGLTATAIYGNYYYIYSALYGVMLVICGAMGASVGNSIVTDSIEKNYRDLQKFSMLFAWIAGWCTTCLLCLYQPFMRLWAGEELLLPQFDMVLFCIYFYVINMNNVRNQYVSGNGMWWRLRGSYLLEAFANLGCNVILGRMFGITGVILATIITIFFFNFVLRNTILFRDYFRGQSLKRFHLNHLYYAAATFIASWVTFGVCRMLPPLGLELIRNGVICVILPNIVYFVMFRLHPLYKEAFGFARQVLLQKRSKKHD